MSDKINILDSDVSEINYAIVCSVVDRICALSKDSFEHNLISGRLLSDLNTIQSNLELIKRFPNERQTSLIVILSSLMNFLESNNFVFIASEEAETERLTTKIKRIIGKLISDEIEISLTLPRNGKGRDRRASYRPKRYLES